jgi:hypothetical protein
MLGSERANEAKAIVSKEPVVAPEIDDKTTDMDIPQTKVNLSPPPHKLITQS